MLFIRSPKVEETFWQICNKSGQISVKEYNFVLYYTIARIVFSNGARAEYGYKAEKAHIQSYLEEYENFKLLKLPFAKVGLTVAVMSMNDFRYYESYQNLRKKVAEQNQKPDDDKFAFVTYSMTKLGHQISENIKDVMVNFEKITLQSLYLITIYTNHRLKQVLSRILFTMCAAQVQHQQLLKSGNNLKKLNKVKLILAKLLEATLQKLQLISMTSNYNYSNLLSNKVAFILNIMTTVHQPS